MYSNYCKAVLRSQSHTLCLKSAINKSICCKILNRRRRRRGGKTGESAILNKSPALRIYFKFESERKLFKKVGSGSGDLPPLLKHKNK